MFQNRNPQWVILGSILAISVLLAGCQSANTVGAEAAQESVSQGEIPAESIHPADRKFFMDNLNTLEGRPSELAGVDPADRKFYADSLRIVIGPAAIPADVDPADRKFYADSQRVVIEPAKMLENVDPADRKFYTDSLWIARNGATPQSLGASQGAPCQALTPEQWLKIDPADRKFYQAHGGC